MGLFLALAGIVFTWVLYTAWQRAEETRRWVPTSCRITSSRLARQQPTPNSNTAYTAEVRYTYTFAGTSLTGSLIKRVNSPSQHEDVARKKLESYPVGTELTCYVNPTKPDQAILKHDSRAPLYSIWFPGLFVVGGLGMVWNALRKRESK